MSTVTKAYRFRVYEADASTVAWTETVNLASVGEVGGQRVSPLSGHTSARPWTVEIVDVNEVITARLADADGRAQLLHRLADLSVSTDGGSTWTVKATGRIARVQMSGVVAFLFEMQDERLIERATTIFEGSNTTRILPRGLNAAWGGYQAPRTRGFQVSSVDAGNNTSTYVIGPEDGQEWAPAPIDQALIELLDADVVDAPAAHATNFTYLRANINGTDRTITQFESSPANDPLKNLRSRTNLLSFKVSGYQDTAGFTRQVFFHMPSADPSPELPLHIGGQEGIDPFTLVKAIYDGGYQSASDPTVVRYESTRFTAYNASTNPHGLIDNPRFPKMHFRIIGPANMAEWLEENIYGPLGVAPFVNAAGEVSPRIVTMPAYDQVPDVSALVEWTPANLAEPHPEWVNEGREQVTVIKATFVYAIAPSFIQARLPTGPGGSLQVALLPTEGGRDAGFDLFAERTEVLTREHDRVATARVLHEITVRGIQSAQLRKKFLGKYARDIFDRFGDGPCYATASPLSSAASPVEGEWVRLNLPGSYPALHNQSRTGSRLAQVIEKAEGIDGAKFRLLEGGPSSNALSAPTINLTASSTDPENAINVQVSGLGTGEGYEVHLAVGGSEPAVSHSDWQFHHLRGDGNETVHVRGMPAGSTIWGRARATKSNRISSDWSSRDSQATTALTAPSSVADSSVVGDAATVTWTNGEADFDVMVDLILTADSSQVKEPVRLFAGATSYRFSGLTVSTGYTARVWHADRFGGESTKATDTLTTTGTAETLPAMRGLQVLVGAA